MPQAPSRSASSVLVAVVALALVAVASQPASERRALRELPDARRAEMLSRTLEELRDFCDPAAIAVKDHCRELAAFAARFDACRGDCEELVRRQLAPSPTR